MRTSSIISHKSDESRHSCLVLIPKGEASDFQLRSMMLTVGLSVNVFSK